MCKAQKLPWRSQHLNETNSVVASASNYNKPGISCYPVKLPARPFHIVSMLLFSCSAEHSESMMGSSCVWLRIVGHFPLDSIENPQGVYWQMLPTGCCNREFSSLPVPQFLQGQSPPHLGMLLQKKKYIFSVASVMCLQQELWIKRAPDQRHSVLQLGAVRCHFPSICFYGADCVCGHP